MTVRQQLKGMFVLLFIGNMPKAAGRKKKPSDEKGTVSEQTD